jgi:hypothetical protein
MPIIDLERLKAEAGRPRGLAGNPFARMGLDRRDHVGDERSGLEAAGALFANDLEHGFDLALALMSDASTRILETSISAAGALAEISAAGDRIDRLNAENAESLRVLCEGL